MAADNDMSAADLARRFALLEVCHFMSRPGTYYASKKVETASVGGRAHVLLITQSALSKKPRWFMAVRICGVVRVPAACSRCRQRHARAPRERNLRRLTRARAHPLLAARQGADGKGRTTYRTTEELLGGADPRVITITRSMKEHLCDLDLTAHLLGHAERLPEHRERHALGVRLFELVGLEKDDPALVPRGGARCRRE